MTPCIVRTHGFFYVQHERNVLKWDIKQQTNTGGEPVNCESRGGTSLHFSDIFVKLSISNQVKCISSTQQQHSHQHNLINRKTLYDIKFQN